MRLPQRSSKAFTLIELIVVIVILGILALIAIPTFGKVIGKSQDESTLTTLRSMARDAQALRALDQGSAWGTAPESAISETTYAQAGEVLAGGTYLGVVDAGVDPKKGEVTFKTSGSEGLALAALSGSGRICMVGLTFTVLNSGRCLPASATTGSQPTSTLGNVLSDVTSPLLPSSPGGGSGGNTGGNTTAPAIAAPTRLSLVPGNTTVNASWTAIANAKSYDLSYAPLSGGTPTVKNVTTPSAAITGLTNGTTYVFTVVAIDGTNRSTPVSQNVTPVGAPAYQQGIIYALGAQSGTWSNPATSGVVAVSATSTYSSEIPSKVVDTNLSTVWNNGNSGQTSWTIDFKSREVRPDYAFLSSDQLARGSVVEASKDGVTWKTLWTNDNQYNYPTSLNTSLASDEYYRYLRVTRSTLAGSAWFAISEFEVYGDVRRAVVSTPTLVAAAGARSVALSANLVDGATYKFERSTNSDMAGATTLYQGTLNTFQDANLTVGTTYYYRVTVSNDTPSSATSTIASAVPVNGTDLTYASSGDTNGLINYLGTGGGTTPFANPATNGNLTLTYGGALLDASGGGGPIYTTDRLNSNRYHSGSAAGSYITYELPQGRVMQVKSYTIRNRPDDNQQHPVNFALEGSVDGTTWKAIDARSDGSVGGLGTWRAYTSNGDAATGFHYLRFKSTGANSSGYNYLTLGEIEFYGIYR